MLILLQVYKICAERIATAYITWSDLQLDLSSCGTTHTQLILRFPMAVGHGIRMTSSSKGLINLIHLTKLRISILVIFYSVFTQRLDLPLPKSDLHVFALIRFECFLNYSKRTLPSLKITILVTFYLVSSKSVYSNSPWTLGASFRGRFIKNDCTDYKNFKIIQRNLIKTALYKFLQKSAEALLWN